LEKDLARAGGRASARPDPWVELDDIRKALPAHSLLIDIARFKVVNLQAKAEQGNRRLPARYAAWVVPSAGQGDVRVIDLGAAEKIEAAVRAVRQALQAAQDPDRAKNPLSQKGEPDAEKDLRQPLEALAKMVLHPLLEQAGTRTQLVLSPDAALWLVPWAALPLPDGRYAVEKYTLRYVTSGRDLVRTASQVRPGRPLVMADPKYDQGPGGQGPEAPRTIWIGRSKLKPRPASSPV
jgi:hypothetical protein